MAITKKTTVQRVEVYPDNRMVVVYDDLFDDPDDELLPNRSQRVMNLSKMTNIMDEEGNVTEVPTDLSKHDPLVQTIAAAVWAD